MIFLRDIVKRCPGAERNIRIDLKDKWEDTWPSIETIFEGLICDIPEEIQNLVFISSGESLTTGLLCFSCVDQNLNIKDHYDQETYDAAEAMKVEEYFPEIPLQDYQKKTSAPVEVIKEVANTKYYFFKLEYLFEKMKVFFNKLIDSKSYDDETVDYSFKLSCIKAMHPVMIDMFTIVMDYRAMKASDLIYFNIKAQIDKYDKEIYHLDYIDAIEFGSDSLEDCSKLLIDKYYIRVLKYLIGMADLEGCEFKSTDLKDLKEDLYNYEY